MKFWKQLIRAISLLILVLLPLYLFGYIPLLDSRFEPSGSPAYQPAMGESFSNYIEQNRIRIRTALATHFYSKKDWPFGTEYPIDKVVQMRAPFELLPSEEGCGIETDMPRKGFLLIHGLTDSPYLLSELAASLNKTYPCAYIRSLLMPGHGTVPGDLLNVDLDDWRQVVQYGIESLEPLVEELYLVGYSNGSPLAIDYLQDNQENTSISGLIFLSPSLAAAQSSISMTPWLKYLVRWVGRGEDSDAAKYDSMPTHSAALFYRMIKKVNASQRTPLDRPVLMVMSGDDTTVDTAHAAEFFCSKTGTGQRKLIWYRSLVTDSTPPVNCSGMEIVDVSVPEARFVSHSHVAISMPPENEHYGLDGNYAVCSTYLDEPEIFAECNSDNVNTLYGENTLRDEDRRYQGKLLRRATFNPYYDAMLAAITCFVDGDCAS